MMLSTVSGGACAAAANGETDNTVTNSIRRIATLLCGRGQGRERIALICAAVLACTSEARPLRLGTTTTVEQSGALKTLAPPPPPAVEGGEDLQRPRLLDGGRRAKSQRA